MTVSMRDAFLDNIYEIARSDRRVVLISNDFGAPSLDRFREDLAGQFIHIGIAEQNMVNVATGLAMAGKIVYMYSIGPFLPLRCYEQLRVHLAFRQYHVTGVMVGAGYAYDLSGPTHHALEDVAVMSALPGITVLTASDSAMGAAFANLTYETPGPKYVRFDREKLPDLYENGADFSEGLAVLREGPDLTIVGTGVMVHRALEVAGELARHAVNAGVIDLYRVKPINGDRLLQTVSKSGRVVTVEESFLSGGIGSIVSGLITDRQSDIRLKRFGVPDRYFSQAGGRQGLHRLCGLDTATLVEATLQWLGGK